MQSIERKIEGIGIIDTAGSEAWLCQTHGKYQSQGRNENKKLQVSYNLNVQLHQIWQLSRHPLCFPAPNPTAWWDTKCPGDLGAILQSTLQGLVS